LVKKQHVLIGALVAGMTIVIAGATLAPSIAAGALLHPARSTRSVATPNGCVERMFPGADIDLHGWFCEAVGVRRGTLVILHGVADTRAGAAGLVQRFTSKGLDVVAYDSRAHGESGGDSCTYGFWEKEDLGRVIDALRPGPVVLLGTSLGAAVALQGAAGDPRVAGVVAAEVFSNLEMVVRHRTPRFVPWWLVQRALRVAEERASFRVADVSPEKAARSITVPVLVLHGSADIDTPPDHSRRVLAALQGPKHLLLIEGARHNESLRDAGTWDKIEEWIDSLLRDLSVSAASACP
jgi:pimeloyl-ACP methyl ester carboxylesterase